MAAALASLALILWIATQQRQIRRSEFDTELQAAAHQAAGRTRSALEKHLISLEQMANFFKNSREVTEEEFYDFASTTMRIGSRIHAIIALGPDYTVRFVHPPEDNHRLRGFDLNAQPEGRQALARARETGQAVFSSPLQIANAASGFILAVPILRGEQFAGAVVASFGNDEFFSSLGLQDALAMYEHVITNSGTPVYRSQTLGETDHEFPETADGFEFGGSTWEIRIRPRPALIKTRFISAQTAIWLLGCALALAAGIAGAAATCAATGVRARLEAQGEVLQQTREKLDGAMHRLLQAEKLTALSDVVAGLAHEMNNPLCSIMGYSQLTLRRDLPGEVRRQIEQIGNDAERMARIVTNLLTFARKHPPAREHLDLNNLVEKTLELKAYQLRSGQIRIEKDLDPQLPRTQLDAYQIQQVLLNLLTNAEQAIKDVRPGGTVQIRTRASGRSVELRVCDDGPGIPEEQVARVFEPFYTTKAGSGTGLGLSLCYGIIQEHGGAIRVEKAPIGGAAFVVELPILEQGSFSTRARLAEPDRPAPGLRILVVDDERSVQTLMVDLLGARGYEVDTASNVPVALSKIAAQPHDLIIIDMRMGQGSGKEIYDAVVESNPRLAQRIIFTTGDGATGATREFVADTGNELVLKPYRIEQLESAIARAVIS